MKVKGAQPSEVDSSHVFWSRFWVQKYSPQIGQCFRTYPNSSKKGT
jgi:hypothetical protein